MLGAAGVLCVILTVLGVGCVVLVSQLDISLGAGCEESDDRLIRAAAEGDREAVEARLDDGADLDREVDGETPLTCAAAAGEVEMVRLLLDAGATATPEALRSSVGARSSLLGTPLMDAPASDPSRDEIVGLLLDSGADPDGGMEGPSPLLYAAWSGQVTTVDTLLARGADPDHGGRVNAAIVTMAGVPVGPTTGSTAASVPRALQPRGEQVANVPPLIGAAWGGHSEIATQLLAAGADPNLVSDGRFSALMAAVLRNDLPMVQLLLEHGATPSPPVDPGVPAPAEVARRAGFTEIAALL